MSSNRENHGEMYGFPPMAHTDLSSFAGQGAAYRLMRAPSTTDDPKSFFYSAVEDFSYAAFPALISRSVAARAQLDTPRSASPGTRATALAASGSCLSSACLIGNFSALDSFRFFDYFS